MNTLHHTLSALLAGAFLNLGLDRLAEFFDPITGVSDAILSIELNAAMPCTGVGGSCEVPAEYSIVA